jgi:diacylglycerol kinase
MSLPNKYTKYNPIKSLGYAFDGLFLAFSREKNLFFQLCLGISLCAIGIVQERYIVAMANLIMMSLVISLEMVNTTIETLCDLVDLNYNPKIKIVKDMAAGSVLIVALSWLSIIGYQVLVWANIIKV